MLDNSIENWINFIKNYIIIYIYRLYKLIFINIKENIQFMFNF